MFRLVGVSLNMGPLGTSGICGDIGNLFFRAQGSTSVNRFLSIDET